MATRTSKQPAPQSRRAGLTRTRVIEAAIELVDRDGLESFSLRRLAAGLGVEPMSLYNHVANKDDLFDGIVEHVMSKLASAGPLTGSWEHQVRQSAHTFRATLLAHPHVSVVVLTRRVLTDMPLGVLRGAVQPLLDAGLPPAEAVVVLRTFTAFMTGAILRELGSAMTFATVDPEIDAARRAQVEASNDPLFASAIEEIAHIDHDAVYRRGIDLLVTGLQAVVKETNS